MKYIFLALPILCLFSCNTENTEPQDTLKASLVKQTENNFNDYWYSGKAELSAYKLEQNRYGEVRTGDAVMIFVTEPFSQSKQVKLDYPSQAPEGDNISVLKLNTLRKFTTGIYDYSMMESLFTPVSLDKYPHSPKATCTSQDWCGHSFTQLNYREGAYRLQEFSYFEAEGDKEKSLGDALLEDEIFTRLRINPGSVVSDAVDLIPNLFFSRTAHEKLKPKKARISLKVKTESESVCTIEYLHLDRTVKISFATEFPHEILGWEETDKGQTSVRAVRKKTLRSPYWQRNGREFEYLRDSLGLGY